MVSKRILVDECGVGLMIRGEPDSEITSGWRFLSGEETPEYAENESNFEIRDLVDVALEYGDSNVLFSDTEIGDSFRCDPDSGEFYCDTLSE